MNYNAEPLELTLTKTVNYTLKPFGKFLIKISQSEKMKENPSILDFGRLNSNSENGMPYTSEDEKKFEKYMKKNKTDILIDDDGYLYTRSANVFVKVKHPKLNIYKCFLVQQNLKDTDYAWAMYMTNNGF